MLHVALAITLLTNPSAANERPAHREASAEREVVTWIAPRPVERATPSGPDAPVGSFSGLSVEFVGVDEDPEGDMPRELAYTTDGNAVAIVHRDTDNVVFHDATTFLPTNTVDVGDYPVSIAMTPDGARAVVPNVFGDSVSIIDLTTHTIEATVPITGTQPFRVAITPDSAFAVVAVINDGITSSFSVIDLGTLVESHSFPSASQGVYGFFFTPEAAISGSLFTEFVLTPDGSRVLLPDSVDGGLDVYDVAGGALVFDIAGPVGSRAIDVSADGAVTIVNHGGNPGTLTTYDVTAGTLTTTYPITESVDATNIALTPDAAFAMVPITNNLIFVDLATGLTTATISTGTVGDIEISFDGQFAFIPNFNASVIDIATQTRVRTITYAATYDAAASPVALRAAGLNNRFRENVHFYDINGAVGGLLGATVSGVPNEGDSTHAVDVAPDGSVAVACNVVSENVSIIDLNTRAVRSYVHVGDRPKEVRITPDSQYAVVCAMDGNQVVVIDLTTDTAVATLPIFNRPGRVRIAPDGSAAYVLNVAGTDRISFIELDGASSNIVAQLPAGQTGSANGYSYSETSGIELSHDGSLLAVCDSFNDLLRLYNTTTMTQILAAPVGDFPIRAAFSRDDDRVYVANAFGDSISVVENQGLGFWTVIATIPSIDFPLTLNVDAADTYLYAGNSGTSAGVRVYDTTSFAVVQTVAFAAGSPRDSALVDDETTLYVASTNSELVLIDAAGPSSAITDLITLSGSPPDFALAGDTIVVAQPSIDGVDVIGIGAPCPADVSGDGDVGFDDVITILANWGPCLDCSLDIDGDGIIGFGDVIEVLANWGPCP